MEQQVPLRCRCGTVRGHATGLSATDGTRVMCYCDDCQAYLRYLGREDLLDPYGGTDIFQCTPSQVTLSEGATALRCLRLSDRGAYRFYAGCCQTPVGNTFSAKLPFVGIPCTFIDLNAFGQSRDALLGPPTHYQFGRYASANVPSHVHRGLAAIPAARSLYLLLRWWLAGRAQPSPYFAEAGPARAPVQVLSRAERDALRPSRTQPA